MATRVGCAWAQRVCCSRTSSAYSLLAVADCNGFVKEMCYVTQEPVTSDSFYDYFTIFVLPHLRPFGEKGGILVLDNVGAWATRRCVFARLYMRRSRAE